jgi:hypothetical protein
MTSPTDGVIITDFSFENSPVYANDNAGLRLEIQNVGGSKAELKKIQIYGVDFSSGISSENKWGLKGGIQELNESYINASLSSKGELIQPDPSINFEGAKDYYEWRLQAPKVVTSETNYDFRTRVEYDYETTYSGTIRVINDNYLQTLSEEDQQKLFNTGGIVSSVLTNGPISVTPYSGRHFIISPGEDEEERIIKFKIENVGKGYPYVGDMTNGNYCININEITGDVIYDCNISNPGYPKIKLSSGKSHTIDCKFKPPTDVINKIDKPFQIKFEYSYYVDASATIKVKPSY